MTSTRAARTAATDPPPGADDRAPTLKMNLSSVNEASGPVFAVANRYSIMLSLFNQLYTTAEIRRII